jgi:hypothetical protein
MNPSSRSTSADSRPVVVQSYTAAPVTSKRLVTVLLNSGAVSSDNTSMGLTLQFAAMALSSTMILRLALAERARLQVELARVRAESGYAVRR